MSICNKILDTIKFSPFAPCNLTNPTLVKKIIEIGMEIAF